MTPPPRHARGFTLVEMLMVLTIVGTTLAIALPRLNRTVRQTRVASLSFALASDVDAAFSLAARNRRPVTLRYDAASGELRAADRSSGTLYRSRALGATSEFRADSAAITPATVVIFPSGFASSAFSIFVRSGTWARRVDVSRTGLSRVIVP